MEFQLVFLPFICAFIVKHKKSNKVWIRGIPSPSHRAKGSSSAEPGWRSLQQGHALSWGYRRNRHWEWELTVPLTTNLPLRSCLQKCFASTVVLGSKEGSVFCKAPRGKHRWRFCPRPWWQSSPTRPSQGCSGTAQNSVPYITPFQTRPLQFSVLHQEELFLVTPKSQADQVRAQSCRAEALGQ